MKRLILGTIPDDFNPHRDIPIGPWCFLDREDIYPGWESFPFEPDPFPTPGSLQDAAKETCSFANSLIPSLADQLNHQNRVCYSKQFWRLMLLPWLISLVQKTYFNLCCVDRFIKKHENENFEVELVSDSIEWKFQNTQDLAYRGILNPIFDHWLYSRIIEDLCPTSWSKTYIEKSIRYDEIIIHNISWKESLYEKLFYNNRCKGIQGIGPVGRILLSILLTVKPQKLERQKEEENCEVIESDIEWPFDFSNIINKTVPLCFKDLKLIACESHGYKPGKYDLIGPLLYYDEKAKFRLGLAAESGEKLICTQHGGSYGIAKVYSYPTEVEYKQYCFFSWGWTRQEDYPGNIIALPSPLLSRFANKHRQTSSDLIFVGTRAHLSMFRIEAGPQPLQNLQYREDKVQFLKALEIHILRNTLYRPYFNDYGALKERSYLEKIFPTLQYCEGALHEKILKCKLLIIDHPDTSFNIALAANIPTIAFWDKKSWPFCRQAIAYFEALEKAGIVFESAQDASTKVNEIWNDVQGWWNQEPVQKARKDWCYKYARTSKLWWWEWAKTLWKI